MPDDTPYRYADQTARRSAWERHYAAKGCSPRKAEETAWRKVQRSQTWPPQKTERG